MSDKNRAWNEVPEDKIIEQTLQALKKNGIQAQAVKNKEEAKSALLKLIPEGSEVMTMTSQTLDLTGISDEINKSGKFNAVRDRLYSMDSKKEKQEMNKLGAAPKFALGSVHAVTENGEVLIASATGSQLPAYAYAAEKIIWVVGAQKIVKNLDDAFKRLYEYTFPLEDARARKVYGMGSGVNKILIVNKEITPDRIHIIFVKENIGF